MSEAKPTPGNWTWRDVWRSEDGYLNARRLRGAGDEIVLEPNTDTDIRVSPANASLLAAAPDLLEACKLIYERLYGDPMTWADVAAWQGAAEAIRAAIAKAEGRP